MTERDSILKDKIVGEVCACFKRVGKPQKKKNKLTGIDEVHGRIDFVLSIETIKAGIDASSEDEVLQAIGGRIVELIRTGK